MVTDMFFIMLQELNGNISSPVASECNEDQPVSDIVPNSGPVLSDMSNRNVPSTTLSNNAKTPKLKSFHTILEKLSPEREVQSKQVSSHFLKDLT